MQNWKMILMLVLILAATVFAYGHAQSRNVKRYHQEYTFNLAEIEKIQIDGTDTQINLIPTEGNEIRVDISGSHAANQGPIEAEQQGSWLKIAQKKDGFHFFNFNFAFFDAENIVNVYLNPEYHKDILIHTVSGPVTIQRLKARDVLINNVSGSIELFQVECDTAKLNTTSGHITARNLTATKSTVASTSGGIKLAGDMGQLNGNNVSGKFEAEYTCFNSNVSIKTVSGSITAKLTDAHDFSLNTSTISGRITNDFGVTLLGSGNNAIRLETVSGRINIQK